MAPEFVTLSDNYLKYLNPYGKYLLLKEDLDDLWISDAEDVEIKRIVSSCQNKEEVAELAAWLSKDPESLRSLMYGTGEEAGLTTRMIFADSLSGFELGDKKFTPLAVENPEVANRCSAYPQGADCRDIGENMILGFGEFYMKNEGKMYRTPSQLFEGMLWDIYGDNFLTQMSTDVDDVKPRDPNVQERLVETFETLATAAKKEAEKSAGFDWGAVADDSAAVSDNQEVAVSGLYDFLYFAHLLYNQDHGNYLFASLDGAYSERVRHSLLALNGILADGGNNLLSDIYKKSGNKFVGSAPEFTEDAAKELVKEIARYYRKTYKVRQIDKLKGNGVDRYDSKLVEIPHDGVHRLDPKDEVWKEQCFPCHDVDSQKGKWNVFTDFSASWNQMKDLFHFYCSKCHLEDPRAIARQAPVYVRKERPAAVGESTGMSDDNMLIIGRECQQCHSTEESEDRKGCGPGQCHTIGEKIQSIVGIDTMRVLQKDFAADLHKPYEAKRKAKIHKLRKKTQLQ